MMSMPRGTDPVIVQRAAREFAAAELAGHRYVMVLHDHQANPHVHLSVRAAARDGSRLNPRKADLHRWRETFAEKLRGWGVEAEASRQATRGENRRFAVLWREKARDESRLLADRPALKSGDAYLASRHGALEAWARIADALQRSERAEDRALALDVFCFVRESPFFREQMRERQRQPGIPQRMAPQPLREVVPRATPDIERGR